MRNLLKIALAANIFEWYEFTIYAYLANIISQVFFDANSSASGIVKVFSIFAIGYLARPLGSVFFGIMGDRISRGQPLKISLMMMAVPTVLIGLLPTYNEVGAISPILLLILRLIQGFAMGAELPTNGCYLFENSPKGYRSILGSILMSSATLGTLLGSFAASLLFLYFNQETIIVWAWRIPFLLSLPLTIAIGRMRRAIKSIPIQKSSAIVFELSVLKQSLFKTMQITSFLTVFSLTLTIWMPFYLTHFLGYPEHWARLTNILVLITLIPSFLSSGYIIRFISYQQLIKIGIITTLLLIYPLWFLLQKSSFSAMLTSQLLLALIFGHMSGIIMEMLGSQFHYLVRCRGMNLAYTFPIAIWGGTTPLVNTWVIEKTGLLMFPAFYIMFFGLLALPAAWNLKRVERCGR